MPSTAAIKHELRMMAATDVLAKSLHDEQCSPEEMSQIISDIGDKYEIPSETVSGLKKRFAAE
jgi:hypothetical protein